MTAEARSVIAELDGVLQKASSSRQAAILQQLTDLFLASAGKFSADQVAIFDDMIIRLIETTEKPALAQLSMRLTPVGNAPAKVVARLSRDDDIAVSGPLLEKSGALADQLLAEIAGAKGQKQMMAIAARAELNELVTDILVERGGPDVARLLAANVGAHLSELGFVKLINKAKGDKTLATTIASRTDVPSELEPFLKLALG